MKKTNEINPYPLRMPTDLREWYASQAKQNGRSINSEIIKILTERRNRIVGKMKSADV